MRYMLKEHALQAQISATIPQISPVDEVHAGEHALQGGEEKWRLKGHAVDEVHAGEHALQGRRKNRQRDQSAIHPGCHCKFMPSTVSVGGIPGSVRYPSWMPLQAGYPQLDTWPVFLRQWAGCKAV